MTKEILLPEEVVMSKIYELRGEKVMIDRDLAQLYGVETKRLKEAVRRNINRFPADFMFAMNANELEIWRTQFASSKSDKQGLRYAPYCFTEQGITMLSCVLNSDRAIGVNIAIVRTFIKMRKMMSSQFVMTSFQFLLCMYIWPNEYWAKFNPANFTDLIGIDLCLYFPSRCLCSAVQ